MAITAQQIIDDVRLPLSDAGATRWTDAELLAALNTTISEIAEARPDAAIVTTDLVLAAGTKQALPTGAAALVDVTRNTSGRAVRKTSVALLDAQRPTWHTDTAAATRNYVYDPRTPRIFYVYPPAVAAASVEIKYRAAPTVLTAVGNTIPIDDTYRQLMIDGVLWRAYAKDAEYASSGTLAGIHKAAYEAGLGRKTAADAAAVPREAAEA